MKKLAIVPGNLYSPRDAGNIVKNKDLTFIEAMSQKFRPDSADKVKIIFRINCLQQIQDCGTET